MAGPRDVRGVRARGALGPRARAGSAGATHSLRDDDEADAADREKTAAGGMGRTSQPKRVSQALRRLGISEGTVKASKGLGDRVRAWQHHGTCTSCGHEARSAQGH